MKAATAIGLMLALAGCGGTGGEGASGESGTDGKADGTGGSAGSNTVGDMGTSDGGSGGWAAKIVTPAHGGEQSALAYDTDGVPHVVYVDSIDRVLRHAWRQSGTWHDEVADGNFTRGGVEAASPMIAAGPNGVVHAVYARADRAHPGTVSVQAYARRDATGWHQETLPFGVWALAVDGSGTLWAASRTQTNSTGTVSVWHKSSAGWVQKVVESFDDAGFPGSSLAMTLDSHGRPWLAYVRRDGIYTIVVATPSATGWTVGATPLSYLYAPFIVDAAGNAHLYGGAADNTPSHVFGSGLFWSAEAVPYSPQPTGPIASVGGTIKIATVFTDGTVTPNRVYLRMFTRGASSWTSSDSLYDPGPRTRNPWLPKLVGFDPAGRPVAVGSPPLAGVYGLSYWELQANGALSLQPVNLMTTIGSFATAVGADGRRRVAFADIDTSDGTHEVRIAVKSSSGWSVGAPVLSHLPSDPAVKLAVGSDGNERVLYFASGGAQLGTIAGGVLTPSAPLASADARSLVFALDGQNRPHLAYESVSGAPSILYALLDGGAWQTSTVATNLGPSIFTLPLPQIAVDSTGTPFVGYLSGSHGEQINLARGTGGVWASAPVATDGSSDHFALAVDGHDRACVAHGVNTSPQSTVAECLSGGAFTSETITTGGPLSQFPLVAAVRNAGKLTVMGLTAASFPGANNIVTLFSGDGATWKTNVVGVVPTPKMAPAPSGDPLLVYLDVTTGRLVSLER